MVLPVIDSTGYLRVLLSYVLLIITSLAMRMGGAALGSR